MTPRAGTGTRLGLYLKEMCTTGSPRNVVWDLYSKPHPSHLAFAGNGAPQLGQDIACSEISCRHSLQSFISSALSPCCWAKVVLFEPNDTRKATGLEEEKVGRCNRSVTASGIGGARTFLSIRVNVANGSPTVSRGSLGPCQALIPFEDILRNMFQEALEIFKPTEVPPVCQVALL